jgi:hypothetical protein
VETLTATRILAGERRGSSRPILVDTPSGSRLVKLRGAAQGTGPLVAEVVVAALAEALELRVPARSVVVLAPDTPTDYWDDELADLLAASVGENLGFAMLEGARDIGPSDLARVDPAEAAAILWLDRLVLNPDRTPRNRNLLWWERRAWLIDHGAALRFQYNWRAVTEDTPRTAIASPEPHLFEPAAASGDWPTWAALFASRLTREVLEAAVAAVPSSFLAPLLPCGTAASPAAQAEALRRRRAAYVAFLWKRLRAVS